jgi:hypothetical protein
MRMFKSTNASAIDVTGIRLLTLLAVAATGACGRLDADEIAAGEALDSAEVSQSEAALISTGVDDPGTPLAAGDLAAAAVAGLAGRFRPSGCATVTRSGNMLTYVLADCTGRFGLVHVSGTLAATLSDGADGVHAAVTGQGMRVNLATMDMDATAVLSDDGGKRKLVVSTRGEGVGPRGHVFTRDGSYTALRDPATSCVDVDGTWQLQVAGLQRTTTVSGLHSCDGLCPAAGAQIVHAGFRGRTITVVFDGSAVARWTSSTGRQGSVELACGS